MFDGIVQYASLCLCLLIEPVILVYVARVANCNGDITCRNKHQLVTLNLQFNSK